MSRDTTAYDASEDLMEGKPFVREIKFPASNVYVDKNDQPVGLANDQVLVADRAKDAHLNPWLNNLTGRAKTLNSVGAFGWFHAENRADGYAIYAVELNEDASIFVNLNQLRRAAEDFSGRSIPWGNNGQLRVVPHDLSEGSVTGYHPDKREITVAVTKNDGAGLLHTDGLLHTEGSFDAIYHEGGHAVQHVLARNLVRSAAVQAWKESFADQSTIFAALQQPERRSELIEEARSAKRTVAELLAGSNSLSTVADSKIQIRDASRSNVYHPTSDADLIGLKQEWYGNEIVGKAQQDLRSDKPNEPISPRDFSRYSGARLAPHEVSHSLTSAAYSAFSELYSKLVHGPHALGEDEALREAARVMGVLQHRSHNALGNEFIESLGGVAKAYLAADIEYFGGAHLQELSDAFISRNLLTATDLQEVQEKFESAKVKIASLVNRSGKPSVNDFSRIELNALEVKARLGIPDDFKLVTNSPSIAEIDPSDSKKKRYIVNTQLEWTGSATPLMTSHAVTIVIREDGTLGLWGSSISTKEHFEQLRAALRNGRHGIYVDPLRL